MPIPNKSEVIKRIQSLSEDDLEYVVYTLDIIERHRGSVTPAEEFVRLVLINSDRRPLDPETVQSLLDEFRDNFATMAEQTTAFSQRYPKHCEETVSH